MMIVAIMCLIVHVLFYIFLFGRLAIYKESKKAYRSEKYSIVVCYKNEAAKLQRTLPILLEQSFDELILVDDNSDDETLELLKAYESAKVKVLSIKEDSQGKKKALLAGIRATTYDEILLTDADCTPVSNQWASLLHSYHKAFVLGYAPMQKRKGIISLFSRYETYLTAVQYLSYALQGIPYMGVGRNLRINKKLVLQNQYKVKGAHLASGDDDLMINALSTSNNTEICIHPDSFMYSDPKTNLTTYLKQKRRHIQTSTHYRIHHQLLLGIFAGTHLFFYLSLLFGLIISGMNFCSVIILLVLKWTLQQIVNYRIMKKLDERDLFWWFPILDFIFFVYLLVLSLSSFIYKKETTWS